MGDVLGVNRTVHTKNRRNYSQQKRGANIMVMASEKEMIEPRGMTREELKELVDEYVKKGGKITECKPGMALNYRGDFPVTKHMKKPK
jgi:hypothetical protein